MRKNEIVHIMIGVSLLVTGLAVFLTILHSALLGLYIGGYVLAMSQLHYLLKSSGMIPWLIVSGAMYLGGFLLLVKSGTAIKKKQDLQGSNKD